MCIRDRYELDTSAAHLVRDNNKCILCRRCVAACRQQFVSVIGANDRGIDTHIACAFEKPLADVDVYKRQAFGTPFLCAEKAGRTQTVPSHSSPACANASAFARG